jgi:NAD(P)-dependent dehydrogenase (short-subunit alcohol dehydrogenase family)
LKRRISTSKPKGKVVSNRLFGRVAIVTGGASGIGRAISIALAKEGSSVVVCDVNEEEATETANEIHAEGGVSIAVKTDVSS